MNEESQPTTKPSETAKGRIPPNSRGDVSWKAYSDQWKANHGTFLMCFAVGVFLIGCGVLLFQQNRFRAPSFPAPGVINRPLAETAAVDSDAVATDQDSVTLRIVGASDGGGSVRVAVYLTAENFNEAEKADWKQSVPLESANVDGASAAECSIPLDVLTDSFAIAVYQDTNDNGALDRGLLGIPSERYGFSNAARGKVGPPSFEQAEMTKPEAGAMIELEIW